MSVLLLSCEIAKVQRSASVRAEAVSPDIHSRCWLDFVEPRAVALGLDLAVFSSRCDASR